VLWRLQPQGCGLQRSVVVRLVASLALWAGVSHFSRAASSTCSNYQSTTEAENKAERRDLSRQAGDESEASHIRSSESASVGLDDRQLVMHHHCEPDNLTTGDGRFTNVLTPSTRLIFYVTASLRSIIAISGWRLASLHIRLINHTRVYFLHSTRNQWSDVTIQMIVNCY